MSRYYDIPFANGGDRTTIPDIDPGDGAVSYPTGWGSDYELNQETFPASARDIDREQENQFKFDITTFAKEVQETGILVYDALFNYLVDAYTQGSDGQVYRATMPNGPTAGVVDPVGDSSGTWLLAVGTAAGTVNTVTPATGAYNPPAGVKSLKFTITGGGGGGGGVDAGVGAGVAGQGVSGSAAGTAIVTTSTIDTVYTITVGTGGSGGAAGANSGSSGVDSTVVSTALGTVTGEGGNGGLGNTASSLENAAIGVVGGSASSGDIDIDGGGSGAFRQPPGGFTTCISSPGASYWGGGARTLDSVGGQDGLAFGSGGAGGVTNNTESTDRAGGAGAPGIVVIEEYF